MTFWNNPLSQAKRFHFKSQTHIEHYSARIKTPSAWDSLLLAKVLKNMQIIVNFKIEGMCIRQSLPDAILRILISRFLVSFANWLAYSGTEMNNAF